MSEAYKNKPSADLTHVDDGTEDHQIDATIRFDGARRESNSDTAGTSVTKQNRDLAFAAALVGVGNISTRRLAEAISDWTTHGHQSLAEHLVTRGVIPSDRKEELERDADRRLKRILSDSIQQSTTLGRDAYLITHLDSTGKLAKLLGLADASMLPSDQVETRQIGARYTLLRRLGQGGLVPSG